MASLITTLTNIFSPSHQPFTNISTSSAKFASYPEGGEAPMATEKQIGANRLNAQHSTGPKTEEGRAAVRLNGVTHGLTAETLVLPGESEADFTSLLASYEAEHQPATPSEKALGVQLAMAAWRLRRLYHAEAGFYTLRLKDLEARANDNKLNDSGRLALVVDFSITTMAMFNRQEARLERPFYRALHELHERHADVSDGDLVNLHRFLFAPIALSLLSRQVGEA
jgi:hypothetical protein